MTLTMLPKMGKDQPHMPTNVQNSAGYAVAEPPVGQANDSQVTSRDGISDFSFETEVPSNPDKPNCLPKITSKLALEHKGKLAAFDLTTGDFVAADAKLEQLRLKAKKKGVVRINVVRF